MNQTKIFGADPSQSPRKVKCIRSLSYCSNWWLGFFFVAPFVMIASAWVYLVSEEPIALGFVLGSVVFLTVFTLIWKHTHSVLSKGISVQGVINTVKPYGMLDGHICFAKYTTVRYSYSHNNEHYKATLIAEQSELKGKDIQPSEGRGIWLILNANQPSNSYVWL